jgi:hypothetical protein
MLTRLVAEGFLRMENRFDGLDSRMDSLENRLSTLEGTVTITNNLITRMTLPTLDEYSYRIKTLEETTVRK